MDPVKYMMVMMIIMFIKLQPKMESGIYGVSQLLSSTISLILNKNFKREQVSV